MTDTPQTLTLNDLPTEIIERFVPDKRPTTISSLKLVSKRFYIIFSYDYYYKFYLHFPEKHYLCEEKCENNSGKEVFKEIKTGSVGKWKGYLSIENIHLKNWSKGEITHSEIVPLGNTSLSFYGFHYKGMWQELIDEDSEHWLLNVSNEGAIVLLNITDKPKMLVYPETDRGAHKDVVLLSGQVMLLFSVNKIIGHIKVLDIVYDGDVISLQNKFAFDVRLDGTGCWDVLSGKCESDGSYKNMFIYGDRCSGILHFHDQTGNVLEDICFRDYKFLYSYANGENLIFLFPKNGLPSTKVKFPYIVVSLVGFRNSMTLVLFNVEKMQVTTFFDIASDQCLSKCYISCNVAYLFTLNFDTDGPNDVNVYRVSLERSCENLEKPTIPYRLYQFQSTSSSSIALSKQLKFAFKDFEVSNKVHVMSVKDFEVIEVKVFIDIDKQFEVLGVIGPDILIIQTLSEPENIISYKIPKEGGDQCMKVVDWGKVVAGNKTLCNALPVTFACQNMLDLVNYSKLVLYYQNQNHVPYLAIFQF